jgi:hypothetical protein
MVDDDVSGSFQLLVDRLEQRDEGVALRLKSLAQKAGLIGGLYLGTEVRPPVGDLLDPVVVG